MKNIAKYFALAALAGALVAGLAGCVTVNVNASSGSSGSSTTTSAAASASAASASSTIGKDASSAAASSAAASSTSGDWGRGNAAPTDPNSQCFGSDKTGYVWVPSDWKDFTSKLDPRVVEASAMTYVVDPTTEFTSAVVAHFAYSSSITLEAFPCKYTEKADELLYQYRGETDNYTAPSIEKTTFNGKNASVLKCTSADNVNITNIAIERDANTCILITAWGTPSTEEAVLSYVNTWTMSK